MGGAGVGAPTFPLPNPPAVWLRRAKPAYAYASSTAEKEVLAHGKKNREHR
jgi:hypothetical protein